MQSFQDQSVFAMWRTIPWQSDWKTEASFNLFPLFYYFFFSWGENSFFIFFCWLTLPLIIFISRCIAIFPLYIENAYKQESFLSSYFKALFFSWTPQRYASENSTQNPVESGFPSPLFPWCILELWRKMRPLATGKQSESMNDHLWSLWTRGKK